MMATGDDTLARARRVVEGLRAAEAAWLDAVNAYPENGMSNDADDLADRICDARERFVDRLMPDAAPALIALAAAVGRLVGATPERAEWWRSPSTDGRMTCRYCHARERLEGGVTSGHYVFSHDDWCAVPAIDAAFAQLAVLADDES